MPRDPSGTYSRTNGSFSGPTTWAQQADSGDKTINAGRHDTHDQDIGDALTDSLSRTGQGAMLADFSMGNFRITDLGTATADNDAIPKIQAETVTATGSTTGRKLADRFAEEINILDDGGVGDGTTNNDTAYAAAEARRVGKGWKKVHFPEGTYLLTTAPDWRKIAGAGVISYNGDLIPAGDIDDTFITLNVPNGAFATIEAAWDYLKTRTIKYAGNEAERVNIQVADGTYVKATADLLNHPQGRSIAVRGNTTTPANCVLRYTHGGALPGIAVSFGHTLGLLDGFTIELTAKAVFPNTDAGILAADNAVIICGTNMRVTDFYYGVQARFGAHIRCRQIYVDGTGDVGIGAFQGGTIDADGATSINASDPVNGLGTGAAPEFGGVLSLKNGTTSGDIEGCVSLNGGHLRTEGTTTGESDHVRLQREQLKAVSGNATANISILPKGTGSRIQFGAGYNPGTPTPDGYIAFLDSTNTLRWFLVATPP